MLFFHFLVLFYLPFLNFLCWIISCFWQSLECLRNRVSLLSSIFKHYLGELIWSPIIKYRSLWTDFYSLSIWKFNNHLKLSVPNTEPLVFFKYSISAVPLSLVLYNIIFLVNQPKIFVFYFISLFFCHIQFYPHNIL